MEKKQHNFCKRTLYLFAHVHKYKVRAQAYVCVYVCVWEGGGEPVQSVLTDYLGFHLVKVSR